MLIEGLPVLDAGSFGESRGAGTHSQACESPECSPGAAAAENYRAPERPPNKYVWIHDIVHVTCDLLSLQENSIVLTLYF